MLTDEGCKLHGIHLLHLDLQLVRSGPQFTPSHKGIPQCHRLRTRHSRAHKVLHSSSFRIRGWPERRSPQHDGQNLVLPHFVVRTSQVRRGWKGGALHHPNLPGMTTFGLGLNRLCRGLRRGQPGRLRWPGRRWLNRCHHSPGSQSQTCSAAAPCQLPGICNGPASFVQSFVVVREHERQVRWPLHSLGSTPFIHAKSLGSGNSSLLVSRKASHGAQSGHKI